ncbi:AsmA family protein [Candidatus Sumerlaeota bacterium]|nr:AsmA family protein [Candidatus Sumerlaeota bacterium]
MSETKAVSVPKPKSRLLKWAARILLGLGLLLVLAVGIGRIMLPGIVKDAIESQGTKYLGTPVTVKGVQLALLRGAVKINGLQVKNYDNFTEANALEVKEFGVNVAPASLMSDTIVVDNISIGGVTANAEVLSNGKQNLQLLMDNLNAQLNPPKEKKPEGEKKEKDKKEKKDAKPKGLLLREFVLTKLEVNHQDNYSRDSVMKSAATIEKFTLENLKVPAAGNRAGSSIMTATLNGFTLAAHNEGFTKPQFLAVPETSMEIDLGKLFDSKNDVFVHIPTITHKGLDFVAEDTEAKPSEEAMPENVRMYIQAVMNTLPGNAPLRYEVASTDEESGDWYAVLTREEPKKEADDSSGSPKKSSKKKKDTGKADEVAQTSEITPPPAIAGETVEEKETPKLAKLLIDEIDLKTMRFEIIRPKEKTAKVVVMDDVNLNIKKVVQPYEDGTESQLLLTLVPQKLPGAIRLEAKGGLTDPRPERSLVADLKVTQFPMEIVPNFEGGTVDASTVMTMKEKVASGTLAFSTKQLKVGSLDSPYDQLKPMLNLISLLQLPEIKVPYSVKMKKGQGWGKIFQKLLDSIVEQLPAGVDASIRTAGKALDEAGKAAMKTANAASKQIGEAADLAGEALDAAADEARERVKQGAEVLGDTAETGKKAVEGVTGSVKDAGKGITGGVKGLLGGKEKTEDKEEKKTSE